MTHLLCSAPAGLFLCLPLMSIMDIGYASPLFSFHQGFYLQIWDIYHIITIG